MQSNSSTSQHSPLPSNSNPFAATSLMSLTPPVTDSTTSSTTTALVTRAHNRYPLSSAMTPPSLKPHTLRNTTTKVRSSPSDGWVGECLVWDFLCVRMSQGQLYICV